MITTAIACCSLALVGFFTAPLCCHSFVPTAPLGAAKSHHNIVVGVVPLYVGALARGGLADPEQDEDVTGRRNHNGDNNNSIINPSSWIQVDGGFLPNLPRRTGATTTIREDSSLVQEVTNLADYKKMVVDDHTATLTVVRFYAPWCRACKTNEPLFHRLAATYRNSQFNHNHHHSVKFLQVPLTKETAVLQQGLGIPSLPYGHIYHADVGLVEERKIGKTNFATFEKVLQTYVQGYCDVTYQEDSPLRP